jgi:hypothetical protein
MGCRGASAADQALRCRAEPCGRYRTLQVTSFRAEGPDAIKAGLRLFAVSAGCEARL